MLISQSQINYINSKILIGDFLFRLCVIDHKLAYDSLDERLTRYESEPKKEKRMQTYGFQ